MKSSSSNDGIISKQQQKKQQRPNQRQRQQRQHQHWYYLKSVIGIASLLSILSIFRYSSIVYNLMDDGNGYDNDIDIDGRSSNTIQQQQQQHYLQQQYNDDDDDQALTINNKSTQNQRQQQQQHPTKRSSSSSLLLDTISSLPTIQQATTSLIGEKRLGRSRREFPSSIKQIHQQKQRKGPGGGLGGNGGGSNNIAKTAVERKLDTTYEKQFTILLDHQQKVVVTVGKQGDAIKNAIIKGMAQKNQGSHRSNWDRIETSICLLKDNDNNDDNDTSLSTSTRLIKRNRNPNNPIEYLPQAILIGVQKGGTTALYNYLDQHPSIAKSTKELYFLDEKVDTFIKKPQGGIPQKRIQLAYGQQMQRSLKFPKQDNNKMILDLTPNYMFYSDRVPQRIQCIVPEAKIFCLLRNPIDRARSQYDMKLRFFGNNNNGKKNQYNQPIPTFDEYIQLDLMALKETGVIQDWNTTIDFDLFLNSSASHEAWRTYINSGLNAPIGMGLYVMQLRNYYPHIVNQQQQSSSSFMAISSEQLQYNTNQTFQQILDFLELPTRHDDEKIKYSKTINSSRRKETISNETRNLLQKVFEPFNHKLGKLLGGDWPNIITNEWK